MKKAIKKIISVAAAISLLGASAVMAYADGAPAVSGVMAGDTLVEVISNENGVFVPLRAVGEALGYEVSWNNDTETASLVNALGTTYDFKIMSKDDFTKAPVLVNDSSTYIPLESLSEVLGEKYTVNGEVAEIAPSAIVTVKEFSAENKSILVDDPERGHVVLYVTDETEITSSENAELTASFEDIGDNDILRVFYSNAMTMSIPPQTSAVAVEILAKAVNTEPEDPSLQVSQTAPVSAVYEGTVKEVSEEGVLISEENYGEILLTISDDTSVHHEVNKRAYTVSDLEAGMKVKAVCSTMMTKSIPPQTAAYEIIIAD